MRPEILFPLFAPISSLKGVGPRVAPLLEKVAGPIVRDVLFLPPQSLIRRERTKAADVREGEEHILVVTIDSHQRPGRGGQPWKIRAFDETGFISLVFFRGHGPHLEKAHPKGERRVVSGRVERSQFDHELQIVHPDYLWPVERAEEVPELEAIYPATAGLASRTVRRFALEALEQEHVRRVIARTVNLEGAAGVLGIDIATLYRKRKRWAAAAGQPGGAPAPAEPSAANQS